MSVGLLALLDDVALLADDMAMATKAATQKTAGILGDDIAVSAEKSTGFKQDRELMIIWQIIKGSLKNKMIILPIVFILSVFIPKAIPILLILGAFYLVFEGIEKIEEYIHDKLTNDKEKEEGKEALKSSTKENVLEIEKEKIKSAITTDFVLSVEIIVIALNAVLDKSLAVQIASVGAVALIATFGVYGLVAALVRLDNVGFYFIKKEKVALGNFLVALLPKIIKVIAIIGTAAMLLVGGEILLHNVPVIHHNFEDSLTNGLFVGIIAGIATLIIVKATVFIKQKVSKQQG